MPPTAPGAVGTLPGQRVLGFREVGRAPGGGGLGFHPLHGHIQLSSEHREEESERGFVGCGTMGISQRVTTERKK